MAISDAEYVSMGFHEQWDEENEPFWKRGLIEVLPGGHPDDPDELLGATLLLGRLRYREQIHNAEELHALLRQLEQMFELDRE